MRFTANARNPEADVWHAFHYSVLCDVPHAVDIFTLLTASAFSFPRYPFFDCEEAELRCYRVVHEAWRENLAPIFFMVLGAWRENGRLAKAACAPEFQQTLLDSLRRDRENAGHSWIGLSNWVAATQTVLIPAQVRSIIEAIRDQVEADRRAADGSMKAA